MNLLILTGLLAGIAGCACLYLASPNQRWRVTALPVMPARVAGAALIVLAWLGLAGAMQRLTASFVLITLLMVVLAVLPYVGALRGMRRER